MWGPMGVSYVGIIEGDFLDYVRHWIWMWPLLRESFSLERALYSREHFSS